MWIRLSVDHTEHQTFTDTLRVHGIIEEAPIDIGLHHTHVVGLRDDIKLSSARGFSKPDRDLLDESLRAASQSQVALLVVEGDETAAGGGVSSTCGGSWGSLRNSRRRSSAVRDVRAAV